MSLPVLAIPEYDIKLYSIPKPVSVRPYLVGEEKILMLAQAGEDPKEIQKAVEQILRTCTFGKVNIGKLPSFDLEYLYLQLRAKSVNNIVELRYRCRNDVEGKECGQGVPIAVDLNTIDITEIEGHTNKIWLNEDIGIQLRWPTKSILDTLKANNGVFEVDLVIKCLETIFTKDGTVYEMADAEPAEIQKFVDEMSIPQFAKIQHFFDTMPRILKEVPFKCPKCGYEQNIVLSGLMDFFV
jgi:T4 bacteriophage base plate protein